ncbi:bifunctional riboflavin kinase/FAD synthetase [Pigmentibacter sp. JX0631]|uniref:bifunctional riboflavin kinase/FAD synthetase n=1 Tax=Pigmentibacter sp. JX0631 TaxID=2976982 RepID=UPI0024697EB6|nr:bifunctional riboflavin kinase/FAD synthetase [Pigmentibacter sp. JX0631]WGL61529.1 bifunctional riboflavin kinase/FAD synthetase [Pigmentibacter sp. JX0631]
MELLNSFKVIGKEDILQKKNKIAITFGNFDGVHLGHIHLLNELKKISKNSPIVVVTFDPHPAVYFSGVSKPLLNTIGDKVKLLLESGASAVVIQPFNQSFANLSADDFCNWLKENFNICAVILGYDFCYGKQRLGNFEHMKAFAEKEQWEIRKAEAFKLYTSKVVSSSSIRELISQGQVEEAEQLLSRPYFLPGTVVRGDQRGRLIGFPTANIDLHEELVVPKYGVYACFVEIESSKELLPAVMNCGVRPTIAKGLKLQIEAHILNFSQDIYGKEVKFFLKKFIRGEMKFESIDQLKEQITKDVEQAKNLFMDI